MNGKCSFTKQTKGRTLNFQKIYTLVLWVQWIFSNIGPNSCRVSFGRYCIYTKPRWYTQYIKAILFVFKVQLLDHIYKNQDITYHNVCLLKQKRFKHGQQTGPLTPWGNKICVFKRLMLEFKSYGIIEEGKER